MLHHPSRSPSPMDIHIYVLIFMVLFDLNAVSGSSCPFNGNQWGAVSISDPVPPTTLAFHLQVAMNFTINASFGNYSYPEQGIAIFGGLKYLSRTANIWSIPTAYTNELWTFDVTVRTWLDQTPTSSTPPYQWPTARAGHAGGAISIDPTDPNKQALVIFGGRNGTDSILADAWVFSFAHLVSIVNVTQIITQQAPSARWGAAATVLNNSLYLAGGFLSDGTSTVDVWVLSFQPISGAWQWLPLSGVLSPSTAVPPTLFSRGLFFLTPLSPRSLLLAGGWNSSNSFSSPFNDTWAFDTVSLSWQRLADMPLALAGGSAFTYSPDQVSFYPCVVWGSTLGSNLSLSANTVSSPSNFILAYSGSSWEVYVFN